MMRGKWLKGKKKVFSMILGLGRRPRIDIKKKKFWGTPRGLKFVYKRSQSEKTTAAKEKGNKIGGTQRG